MGGLEDVGVFQKKVVGITKIKNKKKGLLKRVISLANEDLDDFIQNFNLLIEGKVDTVLTSLAQTVKTDYVVVGGSAVAVHSKGGRALTPDIDILVASSKAEVLTKFLSDSDLVVRSKGLWISTKNDAGVELDHKIASSEFEKEVIKNAVVKKYRGVKLYFASAEYLIVMKLQLLRDRDEEDIALLLKSDVLDRKLLHSLVHKYAKDKVDDLEQIELLATLTL